MELKMKRVNILVVRFQPFTKGHYKCVEEAWKLKKIPTVICMIDTPESKVDKRHPFTSKMLIELYKELFESDEKIADIVTVKNANIVANAETLKGLGYEIASWTCGTDRFDGYDKMATKYGEMIGLPDDYETIEVKRGDDDISATKVREALLKDDRDEFDKLIPNGSLFDTDMLYQELKIQINKVYSAQERYYNRLRRRVEMLESYFLM
jgi:hypothetical protein